MHSVDGHLFACSDNTNIEETFGLKPTAIIGHQIDVYEDKSIVARDYAMWGEALGNIRELSSAFQQHEKSAVVPFGDPTHRLEASDLVTGDMEVRIVPIYSVLITLENTSTMQNVTEETVLEEIYRLASTSSMLVASLNLVRDVKHEVRQVRVGTDETKARVLVQNMPSFSQDKERCSVFCGATAALEHEESSKSSSSTAPLAAAVPAFVVALVFAAIGKNIR